MNRLFEEQLVFINETFESTDSFFETIGQKSIDLDFSKETFIKKLKEREIEFPTGLQLDKYGVAIPHTDPDCINKEFISVVTLEKPVIFRSMANKDDEVEVSVVFILGLKTAKNQLHVLQTLMSVIQNEELMNELMEATDKKELISILEKIEK